MTQYSTTQRLQAIAIVDEMAGRSVGTGGTTITPTAINPTLYSVTLTNANQEYSQVLANAKKIAFQILSGGDIRYAYVTGKVATGALPYYPLKVGAEEVEDLGSNIFNGTLYLAASTAGTIVIIKVWA